MLSFEQGRARLHTLDTEFKRYYMDVVDSLVDEVEVEREQAIMQENENRVAHIFVSLNKLSSHVEPMIKIESKELDVFQQCLDNLERSVRKVSAIIRPVVPAPDIDCCLLEHYTKQASVFEWRCSTFLAAWLPLKMQRNYLMRSHGYPTLSVAHA